MNITTETYGHAAILSIKGELTEDSLEQLIRTVEHQLEEDRGQSSPENAGAEPWIIDIVLDLHNVPAIDSAALEYFLDLQDTLAERMGRLRLCGCDENISKILEITRLDSAFETYKNSEEAIKERLPT